MPMRSLLAQAVRIPAAKAEPQLEAIALEPPGEGEVLVRMEACGICRTDLFIAGLPDLPLEPLTLGHEGVGRVEAVGPGVNGFVAGDRAGVTFLAWTCGECEYCKSGRERFCSRQLNHGFTRNGVLSGLAVVTAQQLVKVPEALASRVAAPLCCAGWTAYSALRETGLAAGQTVAVFGVGGLGHLAVQYAQHRGLRVAVADVTGRKLAYARIQGADVVLPAQEPGRAMLKKHGGADAAVVFTPGPTAIREAFTSLKSNGRLVLVGFGREDYQLPLAETVLKGIDIRGCYLGAREDLSEVFSLALSGVGIPHIEPHSLADVPKVFEKMRKNQLMGRAVVLF